MKICLVEWYVRCWFSRYDFWCCLWLCTNRLVTCGALQIFISSWASDTIWRFMSTSTMARTTTCCLTTPIHYMDQCLLIIEGVLWHICDIFLKAIHRRKKCLWIMSLPGVRILQCQNNKDISQIEFMYNKVYFRYRPNTSSNDVTKNGVICSAQSLNKDVLFYFTYNAQYHITLVNIVSRWYRSIACTVLLLNSAI